MSKITYYRQARTDGDIRSGLGINDSIALESYEGHANSDPILLWYVDVRCEGKLPTEPETARHWLLDHGEMIRAGIKELALKLEVGLDMHSNPVLHRLRNAPKGTRITVGCSAMRLYPGRKIAKFLRETAAGWDDSIKKLEPEGALRT